MFRFIRSIVLGIALFSWPAAFAGASMSGVGDDAVSQNFDVEAIDDLSPLGELPSGAGVPHHGNAETITLPDVDVVEPSLGG
jgi:hypothetical protein